MAFCGGYTFNRFEGTAEPVLRELVVPERVVLPLQTPAGNTLIPLAKEGDTVRAGVRLIRSDSDIPCYMLSPVSGTVASIDESGITIASDGSGTYEPVEGHTRAPWNLGHAEIFALLYASGAHLLSGVVNKTAEECTSVGHVIVNAIHNGPLNQSWSPKMYGEASLFTDGIRTLRAVYPTAVIHIATNKRNGNYFSNPDMTGLAKIHPLSDKYPQENTELLVRDAIHRTLVAPDGAIDASIVVIPFSNVIQTAEVLTQGRPPIDRILMVAGPGVSRPGWYRVRIGTTFGELRRRLLKSSEKEHWRIVRGDLFTGAGIEDDHASVSPIDTEISVIREHDFRELWRFMMPGFRYDSYPNIMAASFIPVFKKQIDTNVHGGVRPCVQCNYCDEVCPVAIYPQLIWKLTTTGASSDSFRFRPYDCVGCGLCDYVCPSKISISGVVTKAKKDYVLSRRADEVAD